MAFNVEPAIDPESTLGVALSELEQSEAAVVAARQAVLEAEGRLASARSQASEAMAAHFVGKQVEVSGAPDEELVYDVTDGWQVIRSHAYFRDQTGTVLRAGVNEAHHSRDIKPRLAIEVQRPSGWKGEVRCSLGRIGLVVLDESKS